jgi:2-oxoisovalerate dehydrogenase E1 component
MNNQYGMGGQTCGETMGYDILARIGAGVNPEMMHAERVDGYNPLAVIDAFKRKKKILEDRKGPVLLDTLTYRISGHSPSDASSYRSKEEVELWENADSIIAYGNQLVAAKIATRGQLDQITESTIAELKQTLSITIDPKRFPLCSIWKKSEMISTMMFSNQSVDRMEEAPV